METVAGLVLISIAFIVLGAKSKRNIYAILYLSIALIFIQISAGIMNVNSTYSLTSVFLIALWGFRIWILILVIKLFYDLFTKGYMSLWGEVRKEKELG